MAVTKNKEVLR